MRLLIVTLAGCCLADSFVNMVGRRLLSSVVAIAAAVSGGRALISPALEAWRAAVTGPAGIAARLLWLAGADLNAPRCTTMHCAAPCQWLVTRTSCGDENSRARIILSLPLRPAAPQCLHNMGLDFRESKADFSRMTATGFCQARRASQTLVHMHISN